MQTVEQIFDQVRENFIYTPDQEQFQVRDDWRHHAGELDNPWRDDCDGFAVTCVEVAAREGYAPDRIMLALCWTETDSYHAVAIIDGMVLDNRQRSVWPYTALNYRWDKARTLNGEWRNMT